MTLLERINSEINDALRRSDRARLDTLRMLKSDLNYLILQKKINAPTDADVLAVIQKAVKKRRDAIEAFERGGRTELADKEKTELAILSAYLPQQMTRAELEQLAKTVIAEIGATSKADMGKAMKALMPRVAGKADGNLVSEVLASCLQSLQSDS
jgi:uncharacterized protein YqeY